MKPLTESPGVLMCDRIGLAVGSDGGLLGLYLWMGRRFLGLNRGLVLVLTLGWSGWIWWHSSLRGGVAPDPNFAWGWFTNLGHAPAFAFVALGLLTSALQIEERRLGPSKSLPQLRPAIAAGVLAVTITYGALDEYHQSFVYGRTATLLDLTTDSCGAISVVWVGAYLLRPRATSWGLAVRLMLGSLACILSALLATLWD
ncbi:MAG: hypothetical protein ACI8QS_002089 [Planctomycetota bacterium]|jgi:hypothetical protein